MDISFAFKKVPEIFYLFALNFPYCMKYYLLTLQRYADFRGRSNRSEYWYFALFNFLFAGAALILDNTLGITYPHVWYGYIYTAYALTILVPQLAVSIRRLHDTSRSAWYMLLAIIPFIGAVWLIVLFALKGTPGPNKYGPDPDMEQH
jgi:uncharacterized membrane protein YhaH (DUF805 family)